MIGNCFGESMHECISDDELKESRLLQQPTAEC